MADTERPAEQARKTSDTTLRTGQAAMDAATRTAKSALSDGEQLTQNTAEKIREGERTAAAKIVETAEAATEMSSKVADQSRDAMLLGVRTAAGVGGRLADISFGRGQHLLASAVQVMDVYRDASERSADRMQALFSSYLTLGRGMQRMQHAWLEMLDHSIENATHKPQDLFRCTNMVELAEVQRDLCLEAIHHAFETNSRLLELAGRTVQDAVRPMQSINH